MPSGHNPDNLLLAMLQKFNPKNKNIKVWVGDGLVSRDDAKVSVFDSVVQGGDACWEGMRVYPEGIFMLDRHLDRLFDSAHTLMFEGIPERSFIENAIKATLNANGMNQDTHIRLTLSRGEKITSGMDPRLNQSGCCLIVLAEWKTPVYDNDNGITVATSTIRRNNPQFLDSKIHHNNLLNNILAKIQANFANVDAALMLDHRGFAAELNGTNIFMARNGKLFTPYATACLHGITRAIVLELGHQSDIPTIEADISLTELYTADEVFCSGSMGELTPITEIDGRKIINKSRSTVFHQMNKAFEDIIPKHCTPIQS